MENDKKKFESIYSIKVKAGKRRTYFVDVRQTKGNDYYLTITESTKRFDSNDYERHKIFLYKEDFEKFADGLTDVVSKIKELNATGEFKTDDHNNHEVENSDPIENFSEVSFEDL